MAPTLLVLEDARPVRRALRALAEGYGCFVLEAATVAEAQAAIATQPVTAMSIDLDLADGTGPEGGLDFLKQLRATDAGGPPALLLTGRREQELSIRPARLRALYINKPVDLGSPEIARFLKTTASWRALKVQLQDIVTKHEALNELHLELMTLYLYLGAEHLPMALGLSSPGYYKRFKPIKKALLLENVHLLWQYLRLDAGIAASVKK